MVYNQPKNLELYLDTGMTIKLKGVEMVVDRGSRVEDDSVILRAPNWLGSLILTRTGISKVEVRSDSGDRLGCATVLPKWVARNFRFNGPFDSHRNGFPMPLKPLISGFNTLTDEDWRSKRFILKGRVVRTPGLSLG